ncbi:MAG: J domain-containing protein [Firmicutes bacterium]|nr:J domain-containing protein [Bacillota bacterium]
MPALENQGLNAWKILGIEPTDDVERIRRAYMALVRQHHPDRFRLDPVRYRQQEERMKLINQAYEWALNHPPPKANSTQNPGAATVLCREHRYPAMGKCKRCGAPICLNCLGMRQSLCNRDLERLKQRRARGRALREWLPLVLLIALSRMMGLTAGWVILVVAGYLAVLGVEELFRHRWFGCLAFLLLPYSLVLAGIWSLIESLQAWGQASPRDPKARSPG